MLFGGLGQNFMNPALGARCFLLIAFTGQMTSFTYDGVTGATPLALIKSGESFDTLRLFLGTHAGTIGETSTLCLLIGAIFLILMGIIDLRIPGTYLVTFVIFIILFGGHLTTGDLGYFIVSELCSGGIMLGAFFMATDYVTSPITPKGKIIFGIVLGCLTGIFRLFGASAEGVSYAIIFSNMLVPLIERWTIPRAFGVVKVKEANK
jgi:electron transport complex protein RnfD/electron transport complex protein RnfC